MNLRGEFKAPGLAWREFPVARALRVRTEPARTVLAPLERGPVVRMDVAQEFPAVADPMVVRLVELVADVRLATASAMRAKPGVVLVMRPVVLWARCGEGRSAIGMTNRVPARGLEMARARNMAAGTARTVAVGCTISGGCSTLAIVSRVKFYEHTFMASSRTSIRWEMAAKEFLRSAAITWSTP